MDLDSDPYQANLRHVAQPASPNGRDKAVSTVLEDFVALWLTEALREFAHYGDPPTKEGRNIALAYVQFIDQEVRENERRYVTLYAHTQEAADTLMGAMFDVEPESEAERALKQEAAGSLADLFLAHAEDEAPESPDPVDLDGGTVEFEEGAAEEAIAEREIAEAEAEHERRMEKMADRHAGVSNRREPRVSTHPPERPRGGR